MVVVAVLLSTVIEIAQLFVPGRHPSMGDVLTNATGSIIGVLLVQFSTYWASPSRRVAGRLSLAWSVTAVAITTLGALALAPSFPRSAQFSLWAPRLGQFQAYTGALEEVSLGGVALVPGRVSTERVRELLGDGAVLRLSFIKGSPPPALAPVYAVFDEMQREVLVVGVDGEDLVLRHRVRAVDWHLDRPDLRASGILADLTTGARVEATVRREGTGYCLLVGGEGSCGVNFTPGRVWGLLQYVDSLPSAAKRLLDALWLAGLAFPLGYWLRRGWRSVVAVLALLGGVSVLPQVLGINPAPPAELAGLVVGLAAGVFLLSRRFRCSAGAGSVACRQHRRDEGRFLVRPRMAEWSVR